MSETIGQLLAAARKARELCIEDVAHKTRIHHEVVRQLEADDYSQIPNFMFVRSFLKIYSEYVEVDASHAIAQLAGAENHHGEQYLLGSIQPEIRERYGSLTSRLPMRPIVASVAALLLLAVGGSYLVSHLYGSTPANPSAAAAKAPKALPEDEGNAIEPQISESEPDPPIDQESKTELVKATPSSTVPSTVPIAPIELDIPEKIEIDPNDIPKAAPVVRKAEPVEPSETEEAPEEEPDPSAVENPPFVVPGFVPSEE